jgi:anti-anti-sigma factor
VEIKKDNDVVVLTPTEEDLANVQATAWMVEQLLKEDGENKIIVDLSRIERVHSLQVGALVTIHVLCYENVAVMKLANASEKLKSLLRMVGLESLMAMHHGVDVAAESFGPSQEARGKLRRKGPVDPRVKRR